MAASQRPPSSPAGKATRDATPPVLHEVIAAAMNDAADLIHPTYRHLSREIHLAGLTVTQWSYLIVAAFAAFALSRVLPFGDTYNISVAVTIAGVPAAATIAGAMGETHALAYVRDLLRWRAAAGLYEPAPHPGGGRAAGYVLVACAVAPASGTFDARALWRPKGRDSDARSTRRCSPARWR